MKVKNLNASSLKTKLLIKKTFTELMNEKKNFSKITVSELTERANINRSTFYSHYNDLFEVIEDFESEISEVLFEDLNKHFKSVESIHHYLDLIVSFLKKSESTYGVILSANDSGILLERFRTLLGKKILQTLSNEPLVKDKKYLDLKITFFIDGVLRMIIRYFRNEIPYSLDEISLNMKVWSEKLFI